MKAFIRASLLLIMLSIGNCYADQLPELGNSSYSSLPPSEEQRLGILFMQEVRKSVPVVKDPILTHYLNDLGYQLVSHSTANHHHFDFFVIDSEDINAFAGPAGHVGVNAGTILLAKNEDELASVLAHEITHVSQHHLARAMENARGSTLKALATVAAALIVGSMGHGDAAIGGIMAAQSLSIESQLGYTRDNEREADRIGMQVLYKSHYDPQAMPRFLTRMSKQQVDLLDGRFSYLRTHPLNEERIADAKSRADTFPATTHPDSINFQLMKIRLLVLSGQYTPSKIKDQYFDDKNKNLVQRYGYGLLLYRGRHLNQAQTILNQLHQQYPENSLFILTLADIYLEQHHLLAAEQILEKSYRTNPDYLPLVLKYSTVLLQQNQSKKALAILNNFMRDHKTNNVDILEQLALAQAKNGLLSRAYLTRAKLYRETDQPEQARLQIQQARKYASASEKAYINYEIERIGEIPVLDKSIYPR